MKRLLVFLALIWSVYGVIAQTMAVQLCWDPSPTATVTKYRTYSNAQLVGETTSTTITIPDLQSLGTYTFHITAVNAEGLESDPSNSLTFHAPRMQMVKPGEFIYSRPIAKANQIFIVESTSDFKTWIVETVDETIDHADEPLEIVRAVVQTIEPMRFYRIRIQIERVGCAE